MSIPSIFTQAGSSFASSPTIQSAPAISSSGSSSDGDSTDISQMGQFMAQLQQLATSNPSEFQQVTGSIATQLQQAAQQQGGSAANFLNNLASKFQTASQTGSLAALEHQGHGHHHGGGGGGLQSLLASTPSSSSTSGQPTPSVFSASSPQSVFDQVLGVIGQSIANAATSSQTTT
jgi:hypothetical protein